MTSCIGEPVSYLRLERHSLRELPAEEEQSVAEHLAQCPACRACFERIQADTRDADVAALAAKLRELPQPRAAGRSRLPRAVWGASALIASVACLLFVVMRPQPDAPGLATTSGTKGDGLGLELVRADAQGQLLEPTHFAAGDRFKVLVSCAPQHAGSVRVLVFQRGEVFEPVAPQVIESCGNRRALAGAWGFDGDAAVELCVVFAAPALELSELQAPDELAAPHVCAQLAPVASRR